MAAEFVYYLWRQKEVVRPDQPAWSNPLPLTRQAAHGAEVSLEKKVISYGHYFESVRDFICAGHYRNLVHAIDQQTGQKISPELIRYVSIIAEKHGAFYHPARINVALNTEKVLCFVINVAIGTAAGQMLEQEYQHLKGLTAEDELEFLPRCYHFDVVEKKGQEIQAMLLGQWFDDYHEFHLSQDSPSSPPLIRVWDDVKGPVVLDQNQTRQLYHQAAMILTAYYNPITFEQIYPWHHAAGDFIVRTDAAGLDVKLITVRNYAPLFDHPGFEDEAQPPEQVLLGGLLVFLLNLSTRMRLDRLDGIGAVVWSSHEAVVASVSGFWAGLSMMIRRHDLPEELTRIFKEYLSGLRQDDFEEYLGDILTVYHPQAPELPVLREHLVDHARTFCTAVADTI